MKIQQKRQIAFAISMGFFTTAIISFAVVALNLGFSDKFPLAWAQSWFVAYAIVIPVILALGPWLQVQVDRIIG